MRWQERKRSEWKSYLGGEALERPEGINEATDIGKFQRCARPIRVPSRGYVVS